MKKALVVGSAVCVFRDLERAPDWPLIVVNWAGVRHLGPIEFWASIHRRLMYKALTIRRRKGGDMDFTAYVKIPKKEKLPEALPPTKLERASLTFGSGSSGLFAVEIALSLGYERLILCGIPLEGTKTLQEKGEETRVRTNKPFVDTFRPAWVRHYDTMKPHVRSMSGWTEKMFGGPEDWLD
jgi:hypothetical protein